MIIPGEDKKKLLEEARNSIASIFTGKKLPKLNYDKAHLFNSRKGAFVTLTKKGMLRGCIGYIISSKPLIETVRDAAVQAAIHDPRFPPLDESEMGKIEIEISILSEPFPMNSYDEITLGEHGLILEEMGRRALLLPQVPIEHKMNKEEYLSALCEKAGIYRDYWREKILNIQLFTAMVFSEKESESGNGKN